MEESSPWIPPLLVNTRATATLYPVAFTAAREELVAAKNSRDYAPFCSTIAGSSCKGP
jgi:hypothetical protein